MGIKQKSTRLKEFYATLVANFPVMVSGMQAGFPAFIMMELQREIDMDVDQMSWLVFAGYFSLLFSPVIVSFLINKYGRKTNIRMILFLFIIGWSVILISTTFLTLLIGTIVCGVAAGASVPLTSTYIAEIARAKYRGSLLAMVWMMGIFGTAFVYILELSLTWRGVVLIILAISTFGVFQLQVIPESKLWYLLKNRKQDALESTTWFEDTTVAIKETEILHSMMKFGTDLLDEEDRDISNLTWRSLKKLQIRPFLLALAVTILRCGTGKVLFTVYPVNVFSQMGTPYDGKMLAIWYGCLNFFSFVMNICTFSTIDRFRRKNVFYIFSIIMIISLTMVVCLESWSDDQVKPMPALIVFCMYIYLLAEGTGYFSILSTMIFEVVPMTQRAIANSVLFLVTNAVQSIYAKVYPYVEINLPFRTLGVFFLFNILLILLIVHFYYPDTRGNMFAGYEKQFLRSINNSQIENIIANDWLRDENLQRLLAGNETFNIDLINSDMVKNLSREWVDRLREMAKQHGGIENTLNALEQNIRIIDENEPQTSESNQLVTNTQMQPIIPEEIFNTVKNSFNIFMERNPLPGANEMWNANKSRIFEQQEWIKNTWIKAANENMAMGSGRKSRKTSPRRFEPDDTQEP